eukprot:2066252-Amphidinium_carterae.1
MCATTAGGAERVLEVPPLLVTEGEHRSCRGRGDRRRAHGACCSGTRCIRCIVPGRVSTTLQGDRHGVGVLEWIRVTK